MIQFIIWYTALLSSQHEFQTTCNTGLDCTEKSIRMYHRVHFKTGWIGDVRPPTEPTSGQIRNPSENSEYLQKVGMVHSGCHLHWPCSASKISVSLSCCTTVSVVAILFIPHCTIAPMLESDYVFNLLCVWKTDNGEDMRSFQIIMDES